MGFSEQQQNTLIRYTNLLMLHILLQNKQEVKDLTQSPMLKFQRQAI